MAKNKKLNLIYIDPFIQTITWISIFWCRYDYYSFSIIPAVGELVVGDRESYQYLVESIRRFPSQVIVLSSSLFFSYKNQTVNWSCEKLESHMIRHWKMTRMPPIRINYRSITITKWLRKLHKERWNLELR